MKKKICRKCMGQVRKKHDPELGKTYPYYCPYCDENMYSFECRVSLYDRNGSNIALQMV